MIVQLTEREIESRARNLLKQAYGEQAEFRAGQLGAIVSVVRGRNSLIVEKTGWGKSLVYFIATRILREQGAGPTLIISPLLALMSNQIDSARALGVGAVTVNSDNEECWEDIYENMHAVDAVIVSPERLANDGFMERLAAVRGIQLVVIDEAHSISDWGHDFRPDYQRVSRLLEGLPGNVAVLGTTATANDRVVSDIKEQLGDDLEVVRGDLIRENLAIQINPPQTREQRLSWLAQAFLHNEILSEGQGIVYCLTHSDCEALTEFLDARGISILPYYSGMGEDENGEKIEQANLASFVEGRTRILAATVKLGMGYDKSDVRVKEHADLLSYLESSECSMGYIAAELDAPDAKDSCGVCANCRKSLIVPVALDQRMTADATRYLGNRHAIIKPRKKWGSGRKISENLQIKSGWVLCADYYSTAGQKIKKGKYEDGEFSAGIVGAAGDYLRSLHEIENIDCVVPVPSLRHPKLVPSFARRLAGVLGLPCLEAIEKTRLAKEQKELLNSAQQEKNIEESTAFVEGYDVSGKAILLVDDMVDSSWTFTVIGAKLLDQGAECVYPFALVKTGGN